MLCHWELSCTLQGFVLAGLLLLKGWPGTRAGMVKAQPPSWAGLGSARSLACNIGGETSKVICFSFPGILYFLLQSYDFAPKHKREIS